MANQNHFNLTLDTLAPTGSITRAFQWGNANAAMAVNLGDASFVKYWFNENAQGAETDPEYSTAFWTPVVSGTTTQNTEFLSDGVFYYHMQLMDSVNNKSIIYDTDAMNFDTTPPVVAGNTQGQLDHLYIYADDSEGSKIITNELRNVIHFEFEDPGTTPSGIVSYKLTSTDLATPIEDALSGDGYIDVVFSFDEGTEDGVKTVNVFVYDAAGNESLVKSANITLDTNPAEGTLVLEDRTGGSGGEGVPLPSFINFQEIQAHIVSEDIDIVGYKAWVSTDAEPANYGDSDIIELTLPAGDGLKVVNAKIIDAAGNETLLTPATVTLDKTAPTVELVSDVEIISNVTGFDEATLTRTCSDDTSGIASYVMKCGNVTIDSGTGAPASEFVLTSNNSMVEGDNTITLEVTDVAGNVNSDTVTIKLDTTVPTGSIGTLDTWYNDEFNIIVNSTDGTGSGVSNFFVWTSTVELDTDVPGTATSVARTGDQQTISSANIDWNLSQSDSNYMHVQIVDVVGNVNYAHAQFGFDDVAPLTPTIAFGQRVYNSTTASATITYSDATSGVVLMRVTGDLTNPTPNDQWEAIAGERNITLTTGDGLKSVYVQVKDRANNISAISNAATTELDTSSPHGTLTLRNPGTTTAKNSPSNDANVDVRITFIDDEYGLEDAEYKLVGDFSGSSDEWASFVPDSEGGMTLQLTATSGNGQKNFTLSLRDNAGNVTNIPTQSFILNTDPPTVTVTGLDYNIISKVHDYRRQGTFVLSTYADEVNFQFFIDDGSGEVSSEDYQAYKVVAYASEAAAAAGSAADTAIPETNGSMHMQASDILAHVAVNALLKGADLELATAGDGIKIITVYMQNSAGTWSEAAQFDVDAGTADHAIVDEDVAG